MNFLSSTFIKHVSKFEPVGSSNQEFVFTHNAAVHLSFLSAALLPQQQTDIFKINISDASAWCSHTVVPDTLVCPCPDAPEGPSVETHPAVSLPMANLSSGISE